MPTTTAVFCKAMFAFVIFNKIASRGFHTCPALVKQVAYGLPHSMHSMKLLHCVSFQALYIALRTQSLNVSNKALPKLLFVVPASSRCVMEVSAQAVPRKHTQLQYLSDRL